MFRIAGRFLRRLYSGKAKVRLDPHTTASPRIATAPGTGIHRSHSARTARHIADAKAPCRRRQSQSTWPHPLQCVQTRPPGGGGHPACRGRHLAARPGAQSYKLCGNARGLSGGQDARLYGRQDARHYGCWAAAEAIYNGTDARAENPMNNCALTSVKS